MKFDHPTQKPLELMRRPIMNHTKHGELVYDPFLGSGTTLVAAELTGRVCCGLELDPKCVDVDYRTVAESRGGLRSWKRRFFRRLKRNTGVVGEANLAGLPPFNCDLGTSGACRQTTRASATSSSRSASRIGMARSGSSSKRCPGPLRASHHRIPGFRNAWMWFL